jgi:hypothetical protein
MKNLSIAEFGLKELTVAEFVQVNGGDKANDAAYKIGYEVGVGVKNALAVIGVWMLFAAV